MPAGTIGPVGLTWPITGGVSGDHGYVRFIRENYLDGVRLKAMQLATTVPMSAAEQVPTRGTPVYIDAYKKINPSGGSAPAIIKNRARFAALTPQTVHTERRALLPQFFDFMEPFDWRDENATMRAVQPGSTYIQAVRGAFAVDADLVFLGAMAGNAFVMDNDGDPSGNVLTTVDFATDGGTTLQAEYPFAAGEAFATVDSAYATDATGRNVADRVAGLTSEKVNGGLRILRTNFAIGPGERVYLLCHPTQAEQLANDVRVLSRDFNALAPLMAGIPTVYNEVMVIPCPSIAVEAGGNDPFSLAANWPGAGNTGRYAWMYAASAMAWGQGGFRSEFDIIPEDGHKYQMAHYTEFSATRMDGAKIVRIECADGITPAA